MNTTSDTSDLYSALINKARDALQHGQVDMACREFMAAAGLVPSDPARLNEIGVALAGLRRLKLARDLFARVMAIEPDNGVANAHLGSILLSLGEPAQAEKHLQKARLAFPNDPNIHFNLAQALQFQKKINSALDAYRTAAETSHGTSPHFHAQLATLLEITNKLDELGCVLEKALNIFPEDIRLNFLMAKYERRQGNHEADLKRLIRLSSRTMDPELYSLIHYEMGRTHDRLEASESAYACFEKANKAQESIYTASGSTSALASSHIQAMNALDLGKVKSRIANSPPTETRPPIFLVGFPRSGTTLLHQILEAHPEIGVLEEHSIIYSIQKELGLHQQGYSESLYSLDDSAIVALRNKYLNAVAALTRNKASTHTIDKLPLNILNIPLIKVLFPHAKIILALRHPCDSVLSCYMQRFTPNSYMANFLSLDAATRFYADVMSLFMRYIDGLSLEYYPIRYEGIVSDLEHEAKNLIQFLGLPWSDSVLDYRRHALNQEIINTPSYHQVVRPLYSEAIERWRRYEQYFAPFKSRLAPFCEKFDYEI